MNVLRVSGLHTGLHALRVRAEAHGLHGLHTLTPTKIRRTRASAVDCGRPGNATGHASCFLLADPAMYRRLSLKPCTLALRITSRNCPPGFIEMDTPCHALWNLLAAPSLTKFRVA
mmetsp:Transcript_1735/g.5585  ORF Transcript_1735/g.5585 Transcript_1735/m.5585 type:complete len:116 (-) Transcript_1735:487-834(-)